MTQHARVVIIGGGVVGASALYHLAQLGWTDALLIERDELASGSTWHAAGNVPNFSTSWNIIQFQRYGSRLYADLGTAVDYPINYHVTGSVRLALVEARMEEYCHVAGMARAQGMEFEVIGPAEIQARFPLIEIDGVLGGLWDPHDGDIDPSQLTQAFAKGARDRGARIERFNPVTAIRQRAGGNWELTTRNGAVVCEVLVNAAGYRAGEVAAMAGYRLPLVTMEHQYLVTEDIPELGQEGSRLPLLRDPDTSYYLRQEGRGLILGPYEHDGRTAWTDGIPADFAFQLFADDLDRLEVHIEKAMARVPALASAGIRRVINGPIPYSPDGNPYIGPQHGMRNLFNCNTFSFGISQAGGAGKSLAELVAYGETEWDLWSFDPRRFTGYADAAYAGARAVELYNHEYAVAFPNEERPAGRPRRTTPLHARLQAEGAVFAARGGWERVAYFARSEAEKREQLSFHRAQAAWFDAVAAECAAVHEAVGLLELGGLARFEVNGAGAADWLETIISRKVPAPGTVAPAYALTPRGGILSEFTVTRLAEDRLLLVAAAAAEWHDWDWLHAHLPDDGSVTLEDRTEACSMLMLAGPRSREVLARLTDADLSDGGFPPAAARRISVAGRDVLVLRISYTGELGWELHVPMTDIAAVHEALRSAGEPCGLRGFGIYALDSLRLEKGYPSWKQDLTTEYTLFEAGLDRFVDLANERFIGRAALLRRQDSGPRQLLVSLVIDGNSADALPGSIVFQGEERVGVVSSGAWGFRIGASVALAYLRPDVAHAGTPVAVEILGRRHPARVVDAPIFDPDNLRLKR